MTRGPKIDDNNKFWQSFMPTTELDQDLTLNHHLALLIEQTRIERRAFEQEIAELRALLGAHNIDADSIESALIRSDKILDTLLRYGQGHSGKLVSQGLHIMPYRWRRKFRNAMSRIK
ncbi:hypothetical protein SIL08_09300 [Scandinavium sp. V105_16]|uniref:Uncharacterized protein n=1 Tax=Scandinavium lactucae TaxID=3095028 RepID=A0AAJ2S8H3_9ENTR|nr:MULTISPECIES: hypothetical protein [unclassified Scandinavium]MDX6020469.1 hypothetical protein [Scandinavium sp. V105_16]MDX6031979.1 hypothetical protein [Scandinavium sp. V105_12]MDX6039823.1 hypothetical protein [Scandinavium sp. V105_6]MDX6051444.1 hypothetical protein [Scandinavium sp. V105_1]